MDNDAMIYEQLRDAKISQSCEGQACAMLAACEEYLLSDFSYKHSVLRLLIRPLFYIDLETVNDVLEFIQNRADSISRPFELCSYMEQNSEMISAVINELEFCCNFYDISYSAAANAVICNDINFRSLDDFKGYFVSCCREHNIDENEIPRIFVEENFAEHFNKIISTTSKERT